MTALFFIVLLIVFGLAFKKKYKLAGKILGVFVLIWIIFLLPHAIRHINIQL